MDSGGWHDRGAGTNFNRGGRDGNFSSSNGSSFGDRGRGFDQPQGDFRPAGNGDGDFGGRRNGFRGAGFGGDGPSFQNSASNFGDRNKDDDGDRGCPSGEFRRGRGFIRGDAPGPGFDDRNGGCLNTNDRSGGFRGGHEFNSFDRNEGGGDFRDRGGFGRFGGSVDDDHPREDNNGEDEFRGGGGGGKLRGDRFNSGFRGGGFNKFDRNEGSDFRGGGSSGGFNSNRSGFNKGGGSEGDGGFGFGQDFKNNSDFASHHDEKGARPQREDRSLYRPPRPRFQNENDGFSSRDDSAGHPPPGFERNFGRQFGAENNGFGRGSFRRPEGNFGGRDDRFPSKFDYPLDKKTDRDDGYTSGDFRGSRSGYFSGDRGDEEKPYFRRGGNDFRRGRGGFGGFRGGRSREDWTGGFKPRFSEHDDRNFSEEKSSFRPRFSDHTDRDSFRGGSGRSRFNGKVDSEIHESSGLQTKVPVTYIPEETSTDDILKDHIAVGDYIERTFGQKVDEEGHDIPQPITCFEKAGLPQVVLDNLQKLDMKQPLPIQAHCIPVLLAKRDLMACAQTGSGKTAAFLIPAITALIKAGGYEQSSEPMILIIEPTRELAIQVGNEARKLAMNTAIRSVVLYGGVSVRYQIEQVGRGCNIAVATPGRLHDFILRAVLSFKQCSMVVLDEADRLMDMGFEGIIREILPLVRNQSQAPHLQILMFSATFPEEFRNMARSFLSEDYIFKTVGVIGAANCDIHQEVLSISKSGKNIKLIDMLREEFRVGENDDEAKRPKHKVLVFVSTKRESDLVASVLSIKQLPATSMNGDRLQKEREEALRQFKSGEFPILVTTSVCARGLDIVGVDHVINLDLPTTIDDYVHRIGRTGRVGNPGRATSFFDADVDRDLAPELVKQLQLTGQTVPDWLLREAGFFTSDFRNPEGNLLLDQERANGFDEVTEHMQSFTVNDSREGVSESTNEWIPNPTPNVTLEVENDFGNDFD